MGNPDRPIFFGIAPTYDTGPLLRPVDKEGVSSAALYTNSTIALRPDTGELVWHYQHVENDQWDLDWVFEQQLVDVEFKGTTQRAVMNVGKMAILEAVEAETGKYMFSVDAGLQNVITAIDPESGAKTIDAQKWPNPERPTDVCPSAFGARSWPPTSYRDTDPSLKAFNDTTGELLWEYGLDDLPSSSVITYKAGGTQYVAVVLGMGNFHIQALAGTLSIDGATADQASATPEGGAAIWVFAL